MHHKDIILEAKIFSIFPSGELYWKDKKTLIISDLHFEKGSSYSNQIKFIPPFDTIETLRQLTKFINLHAVESIIFLGDLIHDKLGFQRMAKKSKELFFEILENINCTLTIGNHDNLLFIKDIGLNLSENIVIDGICFSHHPSIDQNSLFWSLPSKVS
ncbi:MAG: hypothetical protein CM15mP98_12150 [Paracoccaceae bacterium]|nr:MAG: hypothetical protein CM15mP98_12150 [Paracoccaceae bacterium]